MHLCLFLENCLKGRCIHNRILRKGKGLKSRNEGYQFYLRGNGNLVLICEGRPIWTSFTIDDNVDFLYFNKEDNRLHLCGKDSSTKWSAFSLGRSKKIVLQDNRELVVYNLYNESNWKKGNSKKCHAGLV